MKQLFLLFLISCYYSAQASHCERPHLSRYNVYIYSSVGKVPVKVNRCLFNDTRNAYSDISDECLKAFQSGVFEDKWSDKNHLEDKGSPVVLEEYITKADLVKNEIELRSNTICRYDRGFCYDPVETINYAVVWETIEKPKLKCPAKLHAIFEGEVDLWYFKQNELHYLFYYNQKEDAAFYLTLSDKSKCQNNEVWYTEEGYIVSLNPLESSSSSALNSKYFSTRTKKIVSEAILKNCDLRSLSLDDFDEEIDIDYLSDSHNLYLLFKKYQDIIKDSEKRIIEIVNNETLSTTQIITIKVQEETEAFSKVLDKMNKEISELQKTLAEGSGNGGNLDGKLLETLRKKTQENDEIHKQLIQANKKLNQQLNLRNLDLEKLIDKVELIQTVINVHIPEFISKSEVIDKLTDIEIKFNQQIKELAANVTQAMLDHEAREVKARAAAKSGVKGGVKGGSSSMTSNRYELEQLIIEKLKSFNEDQCEAAIGGLKEKTLLLLDELRHETLVNLTALDEKILKKLHLLSAENEPLGIKLKEVDEKIVEIYIEIESNKKNMANLEGLGEKTIKELRLKIESLFEKNSELEKIINVLKDAVTKQLREKVDIGPEIEELQNWVNESLAARDERLDSLEIVTVHLTDDVKKDTAEIIELKNKIHDIIEVLKKFDLLKGDILHDLENEFLLVQNNITSIYQLMDEQSKIQANSAKKLESQKTSEKSQLEKLVETLKEYINNVKVDVISNTDRISKLESEDTEDDDSFEALKKELITQETGLKELEKLVKEQNIQCGDENKNNVVLINKLKENMTELYDILKKHEDLILILQKEKEDMKENTSEESNEYNGTKGRITQGSGEDQTKGGHGQSKGGHGGGNGHHPNGNAHGWHRGRGLGYSHSWSVSKTEGGMPEFHGNTVITSTKTTKSAGSYTKTSHGSRVKGHSSEENEDLTEDLSMIVERQRGEIKTLKNLVAEANLNIQAQENRINNLEEKLEKLILKVTRHETFTDQNIKTLDEKTITNHVDLVSLETQLKTKISKCCSRNPGIKH